MLCVNVAHFVPRGSKVESVALVAWLSGPMWVNPLFLGPRWANFRVRQGGAFYYDSFGLSVQLQVMDLY